MIDGTIKKGDIVRYKNAIDHDVRSMKVNSIITKYFGDPVEWYTDSIVDDPDNDCFGYVARDEIVEIIRCSDTDSALRDTYDVRYILQTNDDRFVAAGNIVGKYTKYPNHAEFWQDLGAAYRAANRINAENDLNNDPIRVSIIRDEVTHKYTNISEILRVE